MKTGGIVVATIAISVAILIAAAAAMVVSGAYDVAADAPHTAVVARAIAFARERSIEVRVSTIKVPALSDPKMIAEGAEHYAAMCTGCHLAPGMKENEMRPGMNPKPPVLASLGHGDPREQFWIIKHGIKMTGMPAWGVTHSDEEIWNIVTFLQKLPAMSPGRYRALTRHAEAHDHMDMKE
jgi:mono/diheme cytochrome c family protein